MELTSFLNAMPNTINTALQLGLINALVVLALFLSYKMLGVCDLSTDGCFTFGAAVGAIVAGSGHPFACIPAAMLAGALSGLVTSVLQTKMGINSLLSGIIVNTGLYSVNIAVMGGSTVNINKADTVFTMMKDFLGSRLPFIEKQYVIVVAAIFVAIVIIFLSLFLRTRLGLAIRATGDNVDMVRSSSIDPMRITIIGLCISGSFTALSGCLLALSQKSTNISSGSGMVTVALASLLIGGIFYKRGNISLQALSAVLGAFVFRYVYGVAILLHMPAFMLNFVSAVIVVLTLSIPYIKERRALARRRHTRS